MFALPGHGAVGSAVGGVYFDDVALVGQGGLCGYYRVGGGSMGEGGDGEVLRWIMSSVREEDGDGMEEEVRSELISGVQYQTKYDDQQMGLSFGIAGTY